MGKCLGNGSGEVLDKVQMTAARAINEESGGRETFSTDEGLLWGAESEMPPDNYQGREEGGGPFHKSWGPDSIKFKVPAGDIALSEE